MTLTVKTMQTQHVNLSRHLRWLLPLAVLIIMAIVLQTRHNYLFLSMETMQLFLWNGAWISDTLFKVGGGATLLSDFLLQFFSLPWVGAAITALLLWLPAVLLWQVCRRLDLLSWLAPLCLLPSAWLWVLTFCYSYAIVEAVSFCLMMLALWIYSLIGKPLFRSLVGAVLAIVLFLLTGPWALAFALLAFAFDLVAKGSTLPQRLFGLLPLIAFLIISLIGVKMAWLPRLDDALEPSMQNWLYKPEGQWFIFLGLALTLLPLLISLIAGPFALQKNGIAQLVAALILLLIIGNRTLAIETKNGHQRQEQLCKLIYLTENERWQDIFADGIDQYNGNSMLLNYVFLAASHQGQLLPLVNGMQQVPPQSLCSNVNLQFTTTKIIAQLYMQLGIPSGAQMLAFESMQNAYSAKSLQILVYTNLAYGADKVAEKYIRLLEQTIFYRSWAKEMRGLLNNKKAQAQNPVISKLRQNLTGEDEFVLRDGFYADLIRTITNNPQNREAVEYAIAWIMLCHDRGLYDDFMARFANLPLVKNIFNLGNQQ